MSEEAGVKDTKLSLGGQAIAKLLGGKHVKYDGGLVRSGHVEIYGHSTEEHCRCPECHRESVIGKILCSENGKEGYSKNGNKDTVKSETIVQ